MQLLLDTHIWLWSQDETKRLTRRVLRAVEDSRNEVWISPVSIWEILGLHHKGRLKLQGGAASWISKALSEQPYREAPFTHDVALATETFALPHHDPMDTLLVASAKVYGLTLVTGDAKLIAAKACAVLANR
jgi:PIN domain nuclease of toxin-antitoxin system